MITVIPLSIKVEVEFGKQLQTMEIQLHTPSGTTSTKDNNRHQKFTTQEKIRILLWRKSKLLNTFPTTRTITSIYSLVYRMQKTGEDKDILSSNHLLVSKIQGEMQEDEEKIRQEKMTQKPEKTKTC